ncbi:hypothetical protein SD70_12790 [Gordoniibacillus kamchatkensis]|uniref:Single cache domain-containing protein n=1 Tax=Gordoniibacillus kamchatkensis TaxID=1590651 RepID=A0ABR5AHU5_9BACL|nr:hypothetical protein [Paenibacillus sp. VKM B-2647]KIL40606.1 hypothetical protein SD70_12790 [Paenibacillus sp. VKM B-2647]
MKRIAAFRFGIFAKLMVLLTVPTVLVLFGLLYSVNDSAKEALIAQKSNDQTMYIERTGQYLDLYLQNIRNVLLSVSQHPVFSKPSSTEEISQVLRNYSQNNQGLINYLFVETQNGQIYSSSPVLYDIIGHPEIGHLFKIANENPGVFRGAALIILRCPPNRPSPSSCRSRMPSATTSWRSPPSSILSNCRGSWAVSCTIRLKAMRFSIRSGISSRRRATSSPSGPSAPSRWRHLPLSCCGG